jgi:hypothetical protein
VVSFSGSVFVTISPFSFLTAMLDFSGPLIMIPSISACPPMVVRKHGPLFFSIKRSLVFLYSVFLFLFGFIVLFRLLIPAGLPRCFLFTA